LQGYTDFDWVGSASDKKIIFGLCFSLGSIMISWASRKHKFVTLNTIEVEYIASCDAFTEAIWLCKLVSRLFDQAQDSTVIHCDNKSCVKLS
jgi:hypothetical protein